MNDNVQTPISEPQVLDLDNAADVILDRWKDAPEPSDSEEIDATSEDLAETEVTEDGDPIETEEYDEDPEDPDDNEPDDGEEVVEEDDDDEEELPLVATDESMVEITVNGEQKQVSVRDLKRLYGQESSLTKKSQDLANQRKSADENLMKTQASYQKLLERAQERFKPYEGIDMLLASRQMEPETFAQLRSDAKQAQDDLNFLQQESGQIVAEMQAQREQATQAAAVECVKVLEDSLDGWGNDLYSDIRTYAVKSGLPQEQVDSYTDPNVILLINKARLYDQSKKNAETKKVKAKLTKSKTGKRVLSSRKAPATPSETKANRRQEAQNRLANDPRGAADLDNIADVLLSRWEA